MAFITTYNYQMCWHVSEIKILFYLQEKFQMMPKIVLIIQFLLLGFISWRVNWKYIAIL
jgi:hypothetical protein